MQGHLLAGGALGRWLIRPMLPATVIAGLLFPRIGRRLAGPAAAGLGYLVAMDVRSARRPRTRRRPRPARGRIAAGQDLDDAAYSVGVWQGVLTHRTLEPVLPRVRDLPRATLRPALGGGGRPVG